jgi:predicted N-formylglutamate amidohydrolase
MTDIRLFLSCEHAGNEIPEPYASHFVDATALLVDHWGWDPGALGVAQRLQKWFQSPLHFRTVSRLLVELNRSIHGHDLFSKYIKTLPWEGRRQILEDHYWPYRREVESVLGEWLREGATIVHVSVHSFTPVWNGEKRLCDVGLLFDPDHRFENHVARVWHQHLRQGQPEAVVRDNYPYLGVDDSFPTHLRRILPKERYAGIEIEMNQGLRQPNGEFPDTMVTWIAKALDETLQGLKRTAP